MYIVLVALKAARALIMICSLNAYLNCSFIILWETVHHLSPWVTYSLSVVKKKKKKKISIQCNCFFFIVNFFMIILQLEKLWRYQTQISHAG